MSNEVIPPGKIKCFITGKLRKDSREERVRQDIARSFVEEYGYEKKNMDIEFIIRMGRAKKRADIVIFHDQKEHTQENIYLISEVKSEDVKPSDKKDGIEQLESYIAASPNASFSVWVGIERLAFKVDDKKGRRVIVSITDIPRKGETSIPKPTKGSLVAAVSLKQEFKRTHNYIYANQGFQKDKAFEELQKLIFIKVYDEQYSATLQFYILPGEPIKEVRLRLKTVFKKVKERFKYIFKKDDEIEVNDVVLAYIIAELQRFSLVDTETDVKGEAYEELVGPNLRGDRGEFFTVRNVCSMTIEILFSLVDEGRLTSPGDIKILDPAVGTGGFLIAGVQKIKQIFSQRGYDHDKLRTVVREVIDNNFYGIDFNPFLVKVSQMNMVMHGDGSSDIIHTNSLLEPEKWSNEIRGKLKFNGFDIVVTNPPFGTKSLIDDPDILRQFELTKFNTNFHRNALPPEQIFIERCIDFLKPGGLLGIVLPDSILSNPGLEWIRDWILRKTYVLASIDLPVETFQPHTGTQTSVLILRKKTRVQEKLSEDYDVFMAIPEKIGHDRRGNKIYRATVDGKVELDKNGERIIDDQLPEIVELFKKWVKDKGLI